jgi:excisionase family DNA binding protein
MTPPEGMPLLLTVAQVAAYLGWHPEVVRRHLRAGDLRGRRVGSSWRVTLPDLTAFIRRHRGRAADE